MKKFLALTVLAIALSGCDKEGTIQTVDWYKKNESARKEMIAKCDNNPGVATIAANCTNAKQAEKENKNARRGWVQPSASGAATKEG